MSDYLPFMVPSNERLALALGAVIEHIEVLNELGDDLSMALDDAISFDHNAVPWVMDPAESEREYWQQVLHLLIELQKSMVSFNAVPEFTQVRRRAYWEINRLRGDSLRAGFVVE